LTLHNMDIYSYYEGEEILERGFAPLLLTRPLPLIREGGQAGSQKNQRFFWVPRGIGFQTICNNRLCG